MTTPNRTNRTMRTAGCLDPLFNANRNYAAPVGSEVAGAAFKDTWIPDDVDGQTGEGILAMCAGGRVKG